MISLGLNAPLCQTNKRLHPLLNYYQLPKQ